MADQENFEFDQELKIRVVESGIKFLQPARTSRDVMKSRPCWYVHVTHPSFSGKMGTGECAPLFGLSVEKPEIIADGIQELIRRPEKWSQTHFRHHYPSLVMAMETAIRSLRSDRPWLLFPEHPISKDTAIPINGLVWMNTLETMREEAFAKAYSGYSCIKFKIGGIDFEDEVSLIRELRASFPADKLEIRLDANGAFSPEEAANKLDRLAAFQIHSIEQPIRRAQWKEMAALCRHSPIPIALDEELIGVADPNERSLLMETIKPAYLVLKPSLLGGFASSENWIERAAQINAGWWATSALESNVGLNAIAQWLVGFQTEMAQGLGTGALFKSNTHSFWKAGAGMLRYDSAEPPLDWNQLNPAQ